MHDLSVNIFTVKYPANLYKKESASASEELFVKHGCHVCALRIFTSLCRFSADFFAMDLCGQWIHEVSIVRISLFDWGARTRVLFSPLNGMVHTWTVRVCITTSSIFQWSEQNTTTQAIDPFHTGGTDERLAIVEYERLAETEEEEEEDADAQKESAGEGKESVETVGGMDGLD